MLFSEIIKKKRDGEKLSKEEIEFFVKGVTDGSIPDYQTTAFLMAVYFRGMDIEETGELTLAMAHSGDMADLSGIMGIKVDKHSTGGVGDKTTLVIAPIVASCGVKVAKMSGRGLGHTGGTVDKLESIPGYRTSLDTETFFKIVNEVGVSVIGQSGNFAPADKKLYALRDVTATIESLPLIVSSIMSKKLASGSDCILLDVKTGSGSFMKTVADSEKLAREMIDVGTHAGKKVMALITNMDVPLGHNIGNSLEVAEAVRTLQNRGPEDLTEICIKLAANMLYLAGLGDEAECIRLAKAKMENGEAFKVFCNMVEAHGGDRSTVEDVDKLPIARFNYEVKSDACGYISHMDSEKCGISALLLGAGRATKESKIDYGAGIVMNKKTGDYVNVGDTLAVMYASDEGLFKEAEKEYLSAIRLSEAAPKVIPIILERIE
ncbi:MAG: pyrimidine-nucleoside phosphorylase [Clostridia bacterium]|nr:pyrimidine-nucleoside phosphorylase [Clostridia bacterium]